MARKAFSAADKARFAEEKAAKVARAKEMLTDGVRALQSSDDWKGLLTRVARSARRRFAVSRYSFANQLLIAIQAPEATMTAGYVQWQSVGRQVRKGEKALIIRQPRPFKAERTNDAGETEERRGICFGLASVFSYEQTEGAELPETPALCATVPADAIFDATLERLRSVALGIEGAPVASIEVRPRQAGDMPRAAGWYDRRDKSIVVIDSGNQADMFSTLAHEIAHAIMHGTADHHDTATKEVEAESVAFIVCHAAGLDTSGASFPYVAAWAGKNTDAASKVLESGERIARAATMILDALYGADVVEEKKAA